MAVGTGAFSQAKNHAWIGTPSNSCLACSTAVHRIDLAGFGSELGFLLAFEKLADSRSGLNAKSTLMNQCLRYLNYYKCVENHSFSCVWQDVPRVWAALAGELYPISIVHCKLIDRVICAAWVSLIRSSRLLIEGIAGRSKAT